MIILIKINCNQTMQGNVGLCKDVSDTNKISVMYHKLHVYFETKFIHLFCRSS